MIMRVLGEKLRAEDENESSGRKMRFSDEIFNNKGPIED